MNGRKINHQFVENYSKKFSEQIVDEFFATRREITGKEIVSLTKSKQINFLVIKSLFNQWQDETKKLESPFFDFKNDKVRKALVQFMNTLSQYILVKKEDFYPLLKNAVEDAIYLVFSPLDFFLAEISQKHPTHLGVKSFKSITKYVKINATPLAEFVSVLEDTGKDKLEIDVALQYANDIFEHVETPEVDQSNFLKALSAIAPLSADDIYISEIEAEEPVVAEEEPAFELDSFLEDDLPEQQEAEVPVTAEPEEEIEQEEEIEEEEESVELTDDIAESLPETEETLPETSTQRAAAKTESIDDTVSSIMDEVTDGSSKSVEEPPVADESVISNFDDDDIDEFVDTTDIPPIDLEPKGVISNYEEEEEPEEPAILNKNFATEPVPTINETLKEEEPDQSLAGKLADKQPVENVFSSISVNQRYMFTNELFGGNGEDFKEAIGYVEECITFDESVELLVQRYAKPYKWDMNSVEVKELLKVIFRKFRD
ncbi:MAG: hypothetical protein AAFQ94_03660 [Bacteroidota bacterium]